MSQLASDQAVNMLGMMLRMRRLEEQVIHFAEDHEGLIRGHFHEGRAQLERLTAADGDHLHLVSGLALEHRQQRVQQPRIARRGGGGEEDFGRLGGKGR